ncbi:hypothetical protein FVEN_g11006 [Fusarium venenatum]|nr:hypothetical protein FVEN_g11006 [Fusarium venenatum]
MVKKLLIAATMASMIPSANAFNPAKDRWLCQQKDAICITSFVWCSTIGEDTAKGCSYPENTWPESPNNFGKNPALVLWDHEYTISWKGTDDNYTTLIEWHFVRDTDRPSNSSNLTWSKKLKNKEKSYTFKFSDLASDFPNKEHDDIDAEQVKAAASNLMNVWAVSQPDRPYDNDARVHGSPWMDKSQHFIVIDDDVVPYLETQRMMYKQKEDVKWHNGVVLGVGVGVPFLLAAAFVLGRFTGRKRVKKISGYKSVESYHSGYNSAYLGGQ